MSLADLFLSEVFRYSLYVADFFIQENNSGVSFIMEANNSEGPINS